MTRPPLDRIPQRQLLEELRYEIRGAMTGRRGARQQVARLVEANPRSAYASHIRYNLGKRKAAWLLAQFPPPEHAASPLRHEPSLGSSAELLTKIEGASADLLSVLDRWRALRSD